MNAPSKCLWTASAVARQGMALLVASQLALSPMTANAAAGANDFKTVSPIKHVIIILGENRTFDHVFATYVPKGTGQTISNLLSKGIILADGAPGPHYSLSTQYMAVNTTTYEINPSTGKTAYSHIPSPLAGGNEAASDTNPLPFLTAAVANANEKDLEPAYAPLLLTGATGIASGKVDTRVIDVYHLGEGVFQLTPGVPYGAYAASPTHGFYQMWQQLDCNTFAVFRLNPSGCRNDLFPWVETSFGVGNSGNPVPSPRDTGAGGMAMAFYNMQQGDAPYLKQLADKFTISDNYHQAGIGGTGLNHILLGFGDAIWYSDGAGNALTPPVNQIENPTPQRLHSGGFSNCDDTTQPGVEAVVSYLAALKTRIDPRCEAGHYYLINNRSPGFNGAGVAMPPKLAPYPIPPSSVRHIGDVLNEHKVSYTYFGEGWNQYQTDPLRKKLNDRYCDICNPFQYASDIMTSAAERAAHIADTPVLYADLANGSLPAVSIVKPDGYLDGHPASSKLDLFEGFVKNIVDKLNANATLRHSTAVFITFDEGGGFYDSGYVQPLDFFGDGTRVPLIIVSDYTLSGRVNHSYADHVSLLKFIERNWSLTTITARSRDTFPNPVPILGIAYVPSNSPAISDLFDAFQFP